MFENNLKRNADEALDRELEIVRRPYDQVREIVLAALEDNSSGVLLEEGPSEGLSSVSAPSLIEFFSKYKSANLLDFAFLSIGAAYNVNEFRIGHTEAAEELSAHRETGVVYLHEKLDRSAELSILSEPERQEFPSIYHFMAI